MLKYSTAILHKRKKCGMAAIQSILIGYLFGGINPAYIIGKLKGIDIRKSGTKNPGASNAAIVMGAKTGVLIALFDILKAVTAINLAKFLFPFFAYSLELAGVGCILGHMYPVFMEFHGGKGVACLAGLIIAFDIKVFVALASAVISIALILDHLVLVPVLASIAFPVIYAKKVGSVAGTMIIVIASAAILHKHVENIKWLKEGNEIPLSVLWKKKEK